LDSFFADVFAAVGFTEKRAFGLKTRFPAISESAEFF
jgi:hypothetical protein